MTEELSDLWTFLSRGNIPVIRENLPENPLSQVKENSLNYAAIEETISEEVLNDISRWINSVK